MATVGERIKKALSEIVGRDFASIQGSDKLADYGYARSNLFSLFEKVEEMLYNDISHLKLSGDDMVTIKGLETVQDFISFIEKISRRHQEEV
ncbi:MAG: hypothetical protein U9Q96_00655 [Patescibacteria group bacterium]|nr:hypothetical protein [Patescibacteria group bacterium]